MSVKDTTERVGVVLVGVTGILLTSLPVLTKLGLRAAARRG
ncbi:MAG TPA: hypothetical protein VGF25_19345 [Thermoleophilaceae bacterium]|jgi:hypothetical protein